MSFICQSTDMITTNIAAFGMHPMAIRRMLFVPTIIAMVRLNLHRRSLCSSRERERERERGRSKKKKRHRDLWTTSGFLGLVSGSISSVMLRVQSSLIRDKNHISVFKFRDQMGLPS